MAKKNGTRTRAEAKKLMWEYYRDNKESLPTWIRECREEILLKLKDGKSVESTFRSILESAGDNTLVEVIVR